MSCVPKYSDPACIKFVNGKFLLATNDPKNPISMVRQKDKGNEHDIVISLTTGETYEDRIGTINQLVEVTSNKGWIVTVVYDYGITISSCPDDYCTTEKIIANTFEAFERLITLSYSPNSEYYLPVSRMLPTRIALSAVDVKLKVTTYDCKARGTGKVTWTFALVSPHNCVHEIADELSDNLTIHFRNDTDLGLAGINVYDRNISAVNVTEHNLSDVLALLDADDMDNTVTLTVDTDQPFKLTYDNLDEFADLLIQRTLAYEKV